VRGARASRTFAFAAAARLIRRNLMSLTLPYALGRDVFVCLCGHDFVLLDLVRDKYLALEVPHAAGLSRLVRGWPSAERVSETEESSTDPESLARALLERGLLTSDPAARQNEPLVLPAPVQEITADSLDERPTVRVGEAASFLAAWAVGKWLRRRQSIERIVARMRRRKDRAGYVAEEFDIERARRVVAVFDSMRAFFFSTRNLCLLECVVLLELFARYRLYPTWVFGVHVRPFVAHCWLQHEDVVLNDTLDRVTDYTPIMRV
jgi:hypothetical protein